MRVFCKGIKNKKVNFCWAGLRDGDKAMYVKGTSTIKRLIKKLDAEDDVTWNDSDKIYRIFLS